MFIPTSIIVILVAVVMLGENGCKAILDTVFKLTWLVIKVTASVLMAPLHIIAAIGKAPLKDVLTFAFGLVCFITAIYLKGA